MIDLKIVLDQNEEEILANVISDAYLEAAAGAGKEKAGNFTHGDWSCNFVSPFSDQTC